MTGTPILVALINDNELTVRGVASVLREHCGMFELVSLASRGTTVIDIALFDPALDSTDSGPTLARLLADPYIRKVALYTWNFQAWTAPRHVERGVAAYLAMSLSGTDLVEALCATHAGQAVSPLRRGQSAHPFTVGCSQSNRS